MSGQDPLQSTKKKEQLRKHSEIRQFILRTSKYLYFKHTSMYVALLEKKHDFTLSRRFCESAPVHVGTILGYVQCT